MVLAMVYSQTSTELVTVYRARLRSGRDLVIDLYTAAISAATGQGSDSRRQRDGCTSTAANPRRTRVNRERRIRRGPRPSKRIGFTPRSRLTRRADDHDCSGPPWVASWRRPIVCRRRPRDLVHVARLPGQRRGRTSDGPGSPDRRSRWRSFMRRSRQVKDLQRLAAALAPKGSSRYIRRRRIDSLSFSSVTMRGMASGGPSDPHPYR